MTFRSPLANILDPVHDELDPLVWDDPAASQPRLKEEHATWIRKLIVDALVDEGYHEIEDWLSIVLTGSLTTYQYDDDSDCDVSLWIDVEKFPEWARGEMIGVMISRTDGTLLPGTNHPMQCFVVGKGLTKKDLYQPGMRSGYSIDDSTWIVPPEKERVHDVEHEMRAAYVQALEAADKMEKLLEFEPEKAVLYWHQLHHRRQNDMVAGKGDFTESNMAYKLLFKRGLIPQIAELSGEHIANVWDFPWEKLSGEPEVPPNLRESTTPQHCGVCKMFDEGKCWGYGNHPVSENEVCDSYYPENKGDPPPFKGEE